jgi:ankyrin repeat protein
MKIILKTLGLVLSISLFGSLMFANGPKSLKSLSFDAVVKSIDEGKLNQSGLSDLPRDLQYSARIALEAIKRGKNLNAEYLKILRMPLNTLDSEDKESILNLLKKKGVNDEYVRSIHDWINKDYRGSIEMAFGAKDLSEDKRKLLFNAITGKDDVNAKIDNEGKTYLMKAAFNNNKDTIKALIDLGANVNATDKSGKTALMWIVLNGDQAKTMVDTAKMLVAAGADITIEAGDKTALDLAKTIGRNRYLRDYLQALTDKK